MNCPKCGATNPDTAAWCGQCMEAFPAPPTSGAPEGVPDGGRQGGAAYGGATPAFGSPPPAYVPGAPATASGAAAAPGYATYSQAQQGGLQQPVPPEPAPPKSKAPLFIAVAVGLVVVVAAAYFVFGGSEAKKGRDGVFEFEVTEFTCGAKERQVVEGEQGAVAHPRNLVARGQFCSLAVTVRNMGSASQEFSREFQQLVDADGNEPELAGYDLETISRPNYYYQPGPDPFIDPFKAAEVKLVWDIPVDVRPVAAVLHEGPGTTGARFGDIAWKTK